MVRMGICFLCMTLFACTPVESDQPNQKTASGAPSISDDPLSSPTTTALNPTVTPSPVATLPATAKCSGLGRPRKEGEITFIEEGRLLATSPENTSPRCLADLTNEGIGFSSANWNASGTRVIVGNTAISRDLSRSPLLARTSADWSRPQGTSVVFITKNGRLMKRSSYGGAPTDISFLARHDDVTYHPAGTHIVTSGETADGNYGLWLATNEGTKRQILARGEHTHEISMLTFKQDGEALFFEADHGNEHHLHRLRLSGDRGTGLDTLDKSKRGYTHIVVSPFGGRIAWTEAGNCTAGTPGTLHFGGPPWKALVKDGPGLDGRTLEAEGWLPGRKLLVTSRATGCSAAQPGNVFVLSQDSPQIITTNEGPGSPTVRAPLPRPPPPPDKEQEVQA